MVPGLIPQKDGSFAISIELPEGKISAEILKALARLAEEGAFVHPTTAQKVMILGLANEETAVKALRDLEEAGARIRKSGKSLQPRTCVGLPWCKLALQETFPLALAIYEAFPQEELPHKFKIGVAGCPACCSWANVLDLGFVGVRGGFKVYLGGKGGYKTKEGLYLTKVETIEEALDLTRRILDLFKARGAKKKRFATVVSKMSPEELAEALRISTT
ncbi:MAG: hypothetical protein GXO20_05010 [Thermodesulfobacteria bacterium]|nr:hypothetical protein [Thermodesulfobacteriota bacterium]